MVFHDYDLGRLTGAKGPVQQRSASDLGQIGLKGGDEGIPTFAEVLEIVGGRVPLLVELKDQHGQMGQGDGRLETAVARDVAGYGGPLALMSFNPHFGDDPARVGACRAARSDDMRISACELALAEIRRAGTPAARYPISTAPEPGLSAMIPRTWTTRGLPIYALKGRRSCAGRSGRARPKEMRGRGADNITFEGYLPDAPS